MKPIDRKRVQPSVLARCFIAVVLVVSMTALPARSARSTTDTVLGSISGAVTDETTGEPIPGICVWAYIEPSGVRLGVVSTDSQGLYSIADLVSGDYRIKFSDVCDGSPTYVTEWYDDQPGFLGSNLVAVSASGNTPGIDAALMRGGSISGTVTDEVTGEPLAGICVSGSAAGSDSFLSSDITDAAGHYSFGLLGSGEYGVYFLDACDGSVDYAHEWFENQIAFSEADLITVTAPADTPGIDAELAPGGTISGTVTDQATGAPLSGICVRSVDGLGNAHAFARTGESGGYTLGGLASGTHRVRFADPCGGSDDYLTEWYDDRRTFAEATLVTVSGVENTPGIDAALTRGGSISGTVTDEVTGEPLAGICVIAGDNVSFSTETTTDSSGNYRLHGLPSGRYGVGFDPNLCDAEHDHATEFFDDKPSFAKADPVPVKAPGETTGIDATLSPIAIVSDVEVSISDKPDPVAVGRTLTYRIMVLYDADRATDVSMMLGYPDGTTLVSVTAHRRSCVVDERLRTVTCDLGDLARDGGTTVRVAIAPGNAGAIAATVTVSAVEPDPDATNNSAVEGTQVLGRRANRH